MLTPAGSTRDSAAALVDAAERRLEAMLALARAGKHNQALRIISDEIDPISEELDRIMSVLGES